MRVHVGPINRPWYTVVGVAADVKQNSLAEGKPDAVYLTEAQSWFVDSEMALVVRARDDATTLLPAVKNAIWSVDPDQPITHAATMKDLLAVSAAERRFAMIIFEAFALAALVLAATGIYGVLAGSVAERTREIGVRSALGASRRDILTLVLRQGMALTGLGVAIGVAGATAATHAIVALLFGVSRLDPLTYLGVIAAAGGDVGDRLLGTGVARGASGSLDHAAVGIALRIRLDSTTRHDATPAGRKSSGSPGNPGCLWCRRRQSPGAACGYRLGASPPTIS